MESCKGTNHWKGKEGGTCRSELGGSTNSVIPHNYHRMRFPWSTPLSNSKITTLKPTTMDNAITAEEVLEKALLEARKSLYPFGIPVRVR